MVLQFKREAPEAQETNPEVWTFRDGQLVPSPWQYWLDDQEEPEAALDRHGYQRQPLTTLGDEFDTLWVELRERAIGKTGCAMYLADLTISGTVFMVALDGPAELLDFLTYITPLIERVIRLEDRSERLRVEAEAERRHAKKAR